MSLAFAVFKEKSRLKALLDHFSIIDDPREPWRVAQQQQLMQVRLPSGRRAQT